MLTPLHTSLLPRGATDTAGIPVLWPRKDQGEQKGHGHGLAPAASSPAWLPAAPAVGTPPGHPLPRRGSRRELSSGLRHPLPQRLLPSASAGVRAVPCCAVLGIGPGGAALLLTCRLPHPRHREGESPGDLTSAEDAVAFCS